MSRAALMAAALAALLAVAPARLRAEERTEERAGAPAAQDGRLWSLLSGPFRRRPAAEVPGHLQVADAARRRHATPSPTAVPVKGADLMALAGGKAGGGKLLNRVSGQKLLDAVEAGLAAAESDFGSGALDVLGKRLEALEKQLVDSVFAEREQRVRAQALQDRVRALAQRVAIRVAFARRNPRVTFIVWAPDAKSVAVVDQQVVREGQEIAKDLVVARIDTNEVTFRFQGEEIAVGLR